MATTDTRLTDGQAETQTFGRACEAHDLKRILTTIADQIADADKRHMEVLDAMQKRLTGLGDEARAVRAQAPDAMVPALDSIEHSMAALADKISEADDARRLAPAVLVDIPAAAAAVEPPAALRSALTSDQLGSFTRREESARAAVKPSVDRFDVVSFDGTSFDEEPWDLAAAEALTKLYESGDANLADDGDHKVKAADGAPQMGAEVGAVHADHTEHAEHTEQVVTVEAAVELPVATAPADVEQPAEQLMAVALSHPVDEPRRSIEDQFVTLATKLEQSLAAMRPDDSVNELGTRFTRLEERLGAAIGETATRADLSSLKSIEAQVEDLTARLDSVQTHFSRLDTIELELRGLAEQINEDNLARLFQRAQPRNVEADAAASLVAQQVPRIETALQAIAAGLSEDRLAALASKSEAAPAPAADAENMAMLVASKLAEQMAHGNEAGGRSVERIDDLRTLLNGFINEQRHGDEQTTTMLDTMQQALIRLLDRMDAIETGVPAQGAAKPAMQQHMPMAAGIGEGAGLARQVEDAMPAAFGRRHVPHDEPDHDLEAAVSAPQERRTETAGVNELRATEAPQLQQPGVAASVVQDASTEGAPLNRDDFIAAARRAARQAAQTAPEEAEAAEPAQPTLSAVPKPAPKPMPKPKPAPAAVAAGKGKVANDGKETVSKRGGRQPTLMTIGVVCMITVGATFMLAKPYIAAATKQALDPAGVGKALPAPANSEAKPGNEGGEEIIDGTSKPGSQKRSSFTAPQSIGEAQTAEGAFVPAALSAEGGAPGSGIVGRIEEGAASPGLSGPSEMPPASIGPNSLRVAASKGDPSAEFEVGARFAEGKGVQQDLKQAVVWYQRSAAKGFAAAQYRLASMFERGLGVKTDLAKASIWYQRAAEQGNVKAMHNLAVLNAGREGIQPDYGVAIRWFNLAADHGLPDSQFNLAIMYETGLGLEKDGRLAYKWFSLAARAGDAEASRRRDTVRAALTPADQRDVDAEIEAWRAKAAEAAINDTRVAGEAWKVRGR